MCFSDARFAYGPFAPHYVPRQYIENYVTHHKVDEYLVLNTTVEDLAELPPREPRGPNRWKVVLRKYDRARHIDIWWEEEFDAVVLANGHYAVPFVSSAEISSDFIAIPGDGFCLFADRTIDYHCTLLLLRPTCLTSSASTHAPTHPTNCSHAARYHKSKASRPSSRHSPTASCTASTTARP